MKLIRQEGYQVPTRLPLSKTEEKMLKKVRRKIKNKVINKKFKKIFLPIYIYNRFQHKKVVVRKKNMSTHWKNKLPNILMKIIHSKNV